MIDFSCFAEVRGTTYARYASTYILRSTEDRRTDLQGMHNFGGRDNASTRHARERRFGESKVCLQTAERR